MQLLEGKHDAACQMKRQQRLRAYGQRASCLHAFAPGLYILYEFQNGVGIAIGETSERGETDTAVAALEQRTAKFLFQAPHGGGNGRLRDPQTLCGGADGSGVGGSHKIFQLLQAHFYLP